MKRSLSSRLVVLGAFLIAFALAVSAAQAGPFDKLKKKIAKATEKTEAVDKKADEATADEGDEAKGDGVEKGGDATADAAAKGDAPTGGGAAKGPAVSAVSTKFDFVAGDKVILMDDFTQDELGEFPARWTLKEGNFEVAEMGGERWLRCTSDNGRIRMKVPPTLPEFWTLEFDVIGLKSGAYLLMYGYNDKDQQVWDTMYPNGNNNLRFTCGPISSDTPLSTEVSARHHVMFMARGTALKIYMDRERLANIPDVTGQSVPTQLDFDLWAPNVPEKAMVTNVRFAEGCRPAKDMLAEGKLVTYGIYFATGSDVVQAESAPVLRQIASYLESKPAVKLKVTGHTDNVGAAASNLDLSKRRAASVAKVLTTQFGVAAERFQTDGKGDTEPISANAKPEGRAMNRRVEFAKTAG